MSANVSKRGSCQQLVSEREGEMAEDNGKVEPKEKMSTEQYHAAGESVLRSLTMWVAIGINRRDGERLMWMQSQLGLVFQEAERVCKEVEEADGISFEDDKVTVQ
jgi:hypothetical protein